MSQSLTAIQIKGPQGHPEGWWAGLQTPILSAPSGSSLLQQAFPAFLCGTPSVEFRDTVVSIQLRVYFLITLTHERVTD